MTNRFYTLGLLLLVALTSTAAAQTGPELVLKPWEEGKSLEFATKARWGARGGVKDSKGYSLHTYQSEARWKITGPEHHDLTFGLSHSSAFIDHEPNVLGGAPALPNQITDLALGVGATVGQFDDWTTQVTLGIGYTGNHLFNDEEGWYAKADLLFTKQLDEQSQLQFIINYDGNRNIFPDIPLPGVAYSRIVSENFQYTVGMPYSSIWWKPADLWTVNATYGLPTSFNIDVAYDLCETVQLYTALERNVDAYRRYANDHENRRIFLERSLVELGLRWNPCDHVGIEVAGGYAFNQEFRFGWDTRDTDRLAKLSDEPFVSLKLDLQF